MNYQELLKSPEWQRKRLNIFNRDDWSCKSCGDTKNQLHAHHIYYEKNLKPWEYDDECIVTLCDSCHQDIHSEINKISALISFYAVVKGWDFIDIYNLLKEGK